jgi:hypothetical protein
VLYRTDHILRCWRLEEEVDTGRETIHEESERSWALRSDSALLMHDSYSYETAVAAATAAAHSEASLDKV